MRYDGETTGKEQVPTGEGLPLGYEVFAGNSTDVMTVEEIVETMEGRYSKSKPIWVMDRGMKSRKNLTWARERGCQYCCQYLIGTPHADLRRFEHEVAAGRRGARAAQDDRALTRGARRALKMPRRLAYGGMHSQHPTHGQSKSSLVIILVALLLAYATGCGLFGRPEVPPPQALAPQPTKAPPETHLLLRLNERRLYVMENDVKQPPQGYPVAIGQPKWPTPTGRFQINEMIENPDFLAFDFNDTKKPDRGRIPPGPNNPLGLRWIGFAYAHGWQVGFHGTAKTSVLGQAVSHGCVRVSNADIVEVYKRVKFGTPVVVEP